MKQEKFGLKGNPNIGLISATFGFFVGFAAVALFGPTARKLQDVMGFSATMLGLLVAAPNLTGSLLRIPFGAWVDKVGGKKPLSVLLIISIVGMMGLTSILFFTFLFSFIFFFFIFSFLLIIPLRPQSLRLVLYYMCSHLY